MTLEYNRSLRSQKNSLCLLNDPRIYNQTFLVQNNHPYLLMTLIYIIGFSSVKTIPLIYWMTLVYIIGPFSHKTIPPFYWLTFVYIIGPFSLRTNPFFFNDLCICNRSLLKKLSKYSLYLLNPPFLYIAAQICKSQFFSLTPSKTFHGTGSNGATINVSVSYIYFRFYLELPLSFDFLSTFKKNELVHTNIYIYICLLYTQV